MGSSSMLPTTNTSSNNKSRERLDVYFESTSGLSRLERDEIIPALAVRSYHLPGNSYWQDWFSYIANNHPLFGIFCHHKLHPVRRSIRLLSLFGSIAFGLAATNIVWLYYETHNDDIVFTVGSNSTTDIQLPSIDNTTATSIEIKQSMIVLWTVGGGTHALFDNVVYYVSACACCLPNGHTNYTRFKRYQKYGTLFVIVAAVLAAATASMVVLLRAVWESGSKDLDGVKEASSFKFLISYCIELCLALLVYYPAIAFTLFSGILGCGRIPLFGGRAYEVRCEQNRDRKLEQTGTSSDCEEP